MAALEHLAEREATRLAQRGAIAVAVTGSLAREDAGPGSDLDLWVIGRVDRRRHLVRAGIPVTLLEETIQRAFSLSVLARVEVGAARPLYDPLRIFPRLRALAQRHRRAARRAALAGLAASIASLRRDLQRTADPRAQLLLLREVLALACARLSLLRRGALATKLRHLPGLVSREVARDIRVVEGVLGPRPPGLQRAIAALAPGGRGAAAQYKLAHGAWAEGALLARRAVLGTLDLGSKPGKKILGLARRWPRRGARARHFAVLFALGHAPNERALAAARSADAALEALWNDVGTDASTGNRGLRHHPRP